MERKASGVGIYLATSILNFMTEIQKKGVWHGD